MTIRCHFNPYGIRKSTDELTDPELIAKHNEKAELLRQQAWRLLHERKNLTNIRKDIKTDAKDWKTYAKL